MTESLSSEDWQDEWLDEDDDQLELEESEIDFDEYKRLAERKRIFHYCSTVGSFDLQCLLTEAELCLSNGDYSSALVCSLASDPNCDTSLAIRMICMYQLGDKKGSNEIIKKYETQIISSKYVSSFLKEKFNATVEVLKFMPQLLAMMRNQGNRNA